MKQASIQKHREVKGSGARTHPALLCLRSALVCLSLFALCACGGTAAGTVALTPSPAPSPAPAEATIVPVIVADGAAAPEAAQSSLEPTVSPAPEYSLTTGRKLSAGQHSPVIAVIGNEPQVRPQMGLMQADILYEFALDRGAQTTRLLAVFSDNYPSLAGPVTDARIYFFDVQREYNAMMAYHGYPDEAGYPAFVESAIDIPAAYVPALRYLFQRDTTVSSLQENTLFCRIGALAGALYGAAGPANAQRFSFGTDVSYANAKHFTHVGLPFCSKDTSSIEFAYNAEDNMLYRYERNSKGTLVQSKTLTAPADGGPLFSEPVRVQNLIVQHVKYTPISERYYNIPLVGNGKCDYFINGVYTPGFWRRDAIDGVTSYFLRDGSPLVLEAGTTWIALNSMQRSIRIQYAA